MKTEKEYYSEHPASRLYLEERLKRQKGGDKMSIIWKVVPCRICKREGVTSIISDRTKSGLPLEDVAKCEVCNGKGYVKINIATLEEFP